MSIHRFYVALPTGYFYADHPRPTGWTHIVLNYIGPNNGQGIRIYEDGAEVASDTTKGEGVYPAGDSRIVVGRYYTDRDEYYLSVEVDDPIYFNAALASDEVRSIYNSAWW